MEFASSAGRTTRRTGCIEKNRHPRYLGETVAKVCDGQVLRSAADAERAKLSSQMEANAITAGACAHCPAGTARAAGMRPVVRRTIAEAALGERETLRFTVTV
jgi:hypothetical protein